MKPIEPDLITKIIASNIDGVQSSDIHYKTNLSSIGLDSISFIKVIIDLEEAFECEIPDSKSLMSEMDTVEKIYQILTQL